jgi:bifunctional DNA-binding transcriptional regulator/antitoxin component of YhaV-PrlF toxin-antitoxin module
MSDNPSSKWLSDKCPTWPTNDRLTDIDSNAFLHYSAKHQPTSLRGHSTMTTLTVTARGQVTFRKDVLQHLGIRPGDKIELDLLPDGRGVIKAARPAGSISGFVGLLAGRTQKVATIEEINEAAAQGWAGKK